MNEVICRKVSRLVHRTSHCAGDTAVTSCKPCDEKHHIVTHNITKASLGHMLRVMQKKSLNFQNKNLNFQVN